MLIGATGDVHSPRFFDDFVKAVNNLMVKPDLFLIVGDMINRGELEEYDKISNVLFGKISCPIVACFGNNEYQELRDELKQKHPEIKFLDDESIMLRIGKLNVGIIGSTGSLDMPTTWQRRNVPDIERIYAQRVDFVRRHLSRIIADFKIVLLHYAPTYKTLEGENPRFYPNLGSKLYEPVLIEGKPDLVVHGHSHRGKKRDWVDTVPIFNAALPLNKQIVLIDTEKDLKPGISRFI